MGALDAGCFEEELENGVGLEEDVAEIGWESGMTDSESELARTIEDAVRVLLQGLGEDPEREGLRRTPHRVAKAFREGTRGYKQKVKDIVQGALFSEAGLETGTGHAGGAGGLVVVRNINLFSYYVFSKRLQDPQRLANEICSALHNSIKPAGVAVALQCWHIQFPEALPCNSNSTNPCKLDMQGWIQVLVSSSSGVLKEEKRSLWDDFLALLKLKSINIERGDTNLSSASSWCPSRVLETSLCHGHYARSPKNGKTSSKTGVSHAAMMAAVTSILHSLGEDPSRKELVRTPHHYVQWLMNLRSSNLDLRLNGLSKANSCNVVDGNFTCPNEIQSVLNIPFCSQCEHHLLPFHGIVHIGYLDKQEGKCIERSVLQSVVHSFACKLQVQERLTRQIAEAVYSIFNIGVMVVVEAHHLCMISRGIEKVGSNTATIAVLGQFSTDAKAKGLFLQTIADNNASEG
ncbi:hypothetical protein OPV22_029956 [Ensete ventricosum]|uniref:GTP cyclohydrolase 1 n=1 Tax=Ensete ventricosum TaxID=4639 RepID=A0AAV8Q8G9_ENSVE|nr:hypothetical protein OPV22_029956 [Ensete ventricosum]